LISNLWILVEDARNPFVLPAFAVELLEGAELVLSELCTEFEESMKPFDTVVLACLLLSLELPLKSKGIRANESKDRDTILSPLLLPISESKGEEVFEEDEGDEYERRRLVVKEFLISKGESETLKSYISGLEQGEDDKGVEGEECAEVVNALRLERSLDEPKVLRSLSIFWCEAIKISSSIVKKLSSWSSINKEVNGEEDGSCDLLNLLVEEELGLLAGCWLALDC
jgi:hypothetical protein